LGLSLVSRYQFDVEAVSSTEDADNDLPLRISYESSIGKDLGAKIVRKTFDSPVHDFTRSH